MRERERSARREARKASRRGWFSFAEISTLKLGRGGGLKENFANDFHVWLGEGFREKHAENDASVRSFARYDFKDGAGADLYVDIAGAAGGEGEVASHEVKATVAAFVEDDFALTVEDEDVFGLEVFRQPIAEDLHAFEETAA